MVTLGGDVESLSAHLRRDGTKAFVIQEHEDIIAWSITRYLTPEVEDDDHAPSGWYLMGVVVRPDRRRRGLAKQLTQARMKWLSTQTQRVFYFTTPDNIASRELHASFGFEEVRAGLTHKTLAFDEGPSILYVSSQFTQEPH